MSRFEADCESRGRVSRLYRWSNAFGSGFIRVRKQLQIPLAVSHTLIAGRIALLRAIFKLDVVARSRGKMRSAKRIVYEYSNLASVLSRLDIPVNEIDSHFAEIVIGVRPLFKYEKVHEMLSHRNEMPDPLTKAYRRMAVNTAPERANSAFVSIDTVIPENKLTVIDFAKIDIEGTESEVFSEPGWLAITPNIAMGPHPEFTDITPLLKAVRQGSFEIRLTDQFGKPCEAKQAIFHYASRTGALRA